MKNKSEHEHRRQNWVSTYDDVLVLQNSVVVVQNNGKERQKACKFVFFFCLLEKKGVLHVQFVFLLIRSIDLDSIFIAVPV